MTDPLSPLAHEIINAGSYDRLVAPTSTPAMARDLIGHVTPAQLLAVPLASVGHGFAMLAGLWLWHDALYESHEIAQADADHLYRTAQGWGRQAAGDKRAFQPEVARALNVLNFWHAIMHRREGDFSNAKYWYARCETQPVMRTIAVGATPILGRPDTRDTQGIPRNGWDPCAFVDWVEEMHEHPEDAGYAAAVEVQRLEWRAVFAECAFAAAGAGTVLGGGIET